MNNVAIGCFMLSWICTVGIFMYAILKFFTTRFNIHPAWIVTIVPVNLVWFAVSILLANGVFLILEKVIHFQFL